MTILENKQKEQQAFNGFLSLLKFRQSIGARFLFSRAKGEEIWGMQLFHDVLQMFHRNRADFSEFCEVDGGKLIISAEGPVDFSEKSVKIGVPGFLDTLQNAVLSQKLKIKSLLGRDGRVLLDEIVRRKLNIAISKINLLVVPGLTKFIGVSGSIAAGTVSDDDDIDIFVVVRNHCAWIYRLILFFRNLRTHAFASYETLSSDAKDKLCVNMIVEARALEFPDTVGNFHELMYLIPVWEKSLGNSQSTIHKGGKDEEVAIRNSQFTVEDFEDDAEKIIAKFRRQSIGLNEILMKNSWCEEEFGAKIKSRTTDELYENADGTRKLKDKNAAVDDEAIFWNNFFEGIADGFFFIINSIAFVGQLLYMLRHRVDAKLIARQWWLGRIEWFPR